MNAVRAIDLSEATEKAVSLSRSIGQPTVVAGALAMAGHGYRRETSDVDIALAVVIGSPSGNVLETAAHALGLRVRAKHGFGGLDLRAGDVRIDVLTLDHEMPLLIPEAVDEAVRSDRTLDLFGWPVFVVSLGYLITMKLLAERKKDMTDIVELIKVRLEAGTWAEERLEVKEVVGRHLGRYAASTVDNLAKVAREELGAE